VGVLRRRRLLVFRGVRSAALGRVAVATLALGSLVSCPKLNLFPPPPDAGVCTLLATDTTAFWEALAVQFQSCVLTGGAPSCRTGIEQQEWVAWAGETAVSQEVHGTVAPGGSVFASPERAPDGDLCISHDDIDWNFNVSLDPAFAAALLPGNSVPDDDHPDAAVMEAEWEAMYLDPTYVAKSDDAGTDYTHWPAPSVDMALGDRVALRGAGVIDCGHSPYRAELHPPYLALWGGGRDAGLVIHVRASALFSRPADGRALPNPPLAAEALSETFALPAPGADGGTWVVESAVDYFLDAPQLQVDQGCNLGNGVDLTKLSGPALNAALASPAARWVSTSTPDAGGGFFALAASLVDGGVQVTLAPLSRPHQALFGATVRARWLCPGDGGC